jgi:hypothetical protein
MRIREIIWPEDQIEHMARHGVTPEEFEEVCSGKALIHRMKSKGKNRYTHLKGKPRLVGT